MRQIVGNKRVATVNPYQIGVGNHGGRDILIFERNPQNDGRHVENHGKWSIVYIVPHGVG